MTAPPSCKIIALVIGDLLLAVISFVVSSVAPTIGL
jgi:hypothetical protein